MISNNQISTDSDDEIDLVALFRAVWRYKYLITLTTILSALVAVYLALTATPIYRAEAVISQVNDSGTGGMAALANQFGGIASLVGMNLGIGAGTGKEAQAVLGSRQLAEEFIKRNDLGAVLSDGAKSHPTLWMMVKELREGVLDISEDDLTGLTTVSMDWKDPAVAARWANAFVALANEVMRTRALEESTRNIAYLKEQAVKTNIVEMQKVIYNLIESETKTQMLANGRMEYAFTVIDPAVAPEIRRSPRRTLMVLVGMVIGVVVGAVAAFVHHRFLSSQRKLRGAPIQSQ